MLVFIYIIKIILSKMIVITAFYFYTMIYN